MFNVGGAEFLVIALVALIILGPDKLPEAARKVGNVMAEVKQMSSGFKRELQGAMNDPIEAAARERGNQIAPPKSEPTATPTEPTSGSSDTGTASSETPAE